MSPLPIARTLPASIIAVLALGGPLLAGGEGWIHDMDQAMKQAKTEGKLILMDFTGSDWCGWCIKLNNEVFSQSIFKEEVPRKFVLVELDFPARKELSEEQKAHNEAWQKKFDIQGFPTIVLTDVDGKPFARTGYRAGGPVPYVEHLEGLIKGKQVRDAALAAASKVDGIARAKLLDWALELEDIEIEDRTDLMDEIIRLDADDLAGLKTVYEQKLTDMKVDEAMAEAQQALFGGDREKALGLVRDVEAKYTISAEKMAEIDQFYVMAHLMNQEFDQGMARIETALAREGVETEMRQQIAIMKVQILMEKGDGEAAIKAFDAVIAMDPGSEFAEMLAADRAEFVEMVETMAEMKRNAGAEGGGDGG